MASLNEELFIAQVSLRAAVSPGDAEKFFALYQEILLEGTSGTG